MLMCFLCKSCLHYHIHALNKFNLRTNYFIIINNDQSLCKNSGKSRFLRCKPFSIFQVWTILMCSGNQARIQDFTQGDTRFCKWKIIQKGKKGKLSDRAGAKKIVLNGFFLWWKRIKIWTVLMCSGLDFTNVFRFGLYYCVQVWTVLKCSDLDCTNVFRFGLY